MELTPDYVRENLQDLGSKEAIRLLKNWVLNSNDQNKRKQAILILREIDTHHNYSFFEELFLSDENLNISLLAGRHLKEIYFKNKKIYNLLKYNLDHANHVEKKLIAIEILNKIDSEASRKILIQFLKNALKNHFKQDVSNFPRKILSHPLDSTLSQDIIDTCNNIILYDFYVNECGYYVTLRKGRVILLNTEGFRLEKISQIPSLNRLEDLEHLILRRNNISTIENIRHLQKLKILDLSQNKISKIQSLDSLKNLSELNLSSNYIEIIENLYVLEGLKKLSLDHNRIKKIDGLQNLTKLEELNLNNNKIKHITNLESLNSLINLNLSHNIIEQIKGLENLSRLKWLHLNNNEITKIEGLTTLIELKGLYLSNNNIKKIENLENLIELRKIELSQNQITSIEGLTTLENLQELFLDYNRIEKIEGINELRNLIILFLKSNQITHFSNKLIENLKNLNFIFLNDNPLNPESKICYNKRTRYP